MTRKVIRQGFSSLSNRENRLNKANAATIIAISGLIGYILLRYILPTLQIERLILIAGFSITALILMFMQRRERHKPSA
jgi:TctA family transporter